ncbi:MAG TPA: aspartate aminotransferase family protein [Bacteroides sp.]|nr:aspartate aminotransferase family protein [Bacteroides sp.]
MLDPKNFHYVSADITAWIDKYLNQITSFPVKSQVRPGEILEKLPRQAPAQSESLDQIMKDLDEIILPGITHWQHPNFHGYFPANNSVESILAEFITAAIGAQCMIWDTSPAAAELEQRMMEWLREAMGLPSGMEGVIQDSASSASLAALLTAREVATGFSSNQDGISGKLRVYCSSEAHSSIEKAMGICGMGRNNLVKVGVDEQLRLLPGQLERLIIADLAADYIPCAVVATMGTTGTVSVDPLKEIAQVCEKYDLWLHVDGAFAGTALMLPEYRWMSEGMERVDSFVFNPHKWMFTNFDCSVFFVKNPQLLIRTFEILPEYLKTKTRGTVNDYRDWGVPLGRRFRALKLWFVMRSMGLTEIRETLRKHIRLNDLFANEMGRREEFELLLPPFLNFTCFRMKPDGNSDEATSNRLNEKLLEAINGRGHIFLTHTRISGLFALRIMFGQTYVEQVHVELALEEIFRVAELVR